MGLRNDIQSMSSMQKRQLKARIKMLLNNVIIHVIVATVLLYAALMLVEKL